MLVGVLRGFCECQPRDFGLDSVVNGKQANVFEQEHDSIKVMV